MPLRMCEPDGYRVEVVEDLDALVPDKREGWYVTPPRARRRQRRYGKRSIKTSLHADIDRYDT